MPEIEINEDVKNFLESEGIDVGEFTNEFLEDYVETSQDLSPLKEEIREVELEIEELESKLKTKRSRLRDLKTEKLQKEQFLTMVEKSGSQEEILLDASKDEVKNLIEELCSTSEDRIAELNEIVSAGKRRGFTESSVREEIEELRRKGELIEPGESEFRPV
jgi:predicted  nucleic acid-binding Zn-ribbon protein